MIEKGRRSAFLFFFQLNAVSFSDDNVSSLRPLGTGAIEENTTVSSNEKRSLPILYALFKILLHCGK